MSFAFTPQLIYRFTHHHHQGHVKNPFFKTRSNPGDQSKTRASRLAVPQLLIQGLSGRQDQSERRIRTRFQQHDIRTYITCASHWDTQLFHWVGRVSVTLLQVPHTLTKSIQAVNWWWKSSILSATGPAEDPKLLWKRSFESNLATVQPHKSVLDVMKICRNLCIWKVMGGLFTARRRKRNGTVQS